MTLDLPDGSESGKVAAATPRLHLQPLAEANAAIGYYSPDAPITNFAGNLPHWRQDGVMYFVTFRQSDSLPQVKLQQWREEMILWMAEHPEPHDAATRAEFYDRFPARLQRWLDAGYGSCVLRIPEAKSLVERALQQFNGQRYALDEFVVAPKHVHVLVTPTPGEDLSEILHSWKSYTAHEILKVEAASRRLENRGVDSTIHVWQKESFDHIVRSPASLERFREYIRAHKSLSSPGSVDA